MLIITSIIIATLLFDFGLVQKFVHLFEGYKWIGIFLSGLFFTSIFTTAPSIVLLTGFAQNSSLSELVIFGGLGAMIGDFILFKFIKDRISEDFKYLFNFSKKKRAREIFRTNIFRFFVPTIGALIIASPLPDEIGIAMLGMTKINNRFFLALSFIFNGIGIAIVGAIAQTLIGI